MRVNELNEVRVVPADSITPSERNPRRINDAAVGIVAKSLKRFGWQQPIVVDQAMTIIAGHTRHRAAQKLGLKDVPVVVADLTADEAKAYRIADNRTSDFSQWDFPELVQQLEELADDFADELALADWEAVAAEYEAVLTELNPPSIEVGGATTVDGASTTSNGQTTAPTGTGHESAKPVGGHELSVSNLVTQEAEEQFALTVICDSPHTAGTVQALLLDQEGVIDVRYKRN